MQKIIDAINVKKQLGNILTDIIVESIKTTKNGQEIIQFDFACKYANENGETVDHQLLTVDEVGVLLKDTLMENLQS